MIARHRLVLSGLALSVVSLLPAQDLVWRKLQDSTYYAVSMAFDAARQRFVMVSGSRTLEWDGSSWQQRQTATPAPSRDYHQIVYDRARRRVVLFGGMEYVAGLPPAPNATLWEYDGVDWSARTSPGPSARSQHAMGYDQARNRVVLFGGYDVGDLDDTWEWDGTSWTQVSPAQSPSPRVLPAMAFHAATGRMILFGGNGRVGSNPQVQFQDTWAYDGTTWTQQTPMTVPPARCGHRMSADNAASRVLMYGGIDQTIGDLADTWEWNGQDWSLRLSSNTQMLRQGEALATDDAGVTLMAGGIHSDWHPQPEQTIFGDTWRLTAGQPWVQVTATGPTYRTNPTFAYDSVRDRIVLAGGSSGSYHYTWEWDGATWTRMTPTVELPTLMWPASCFDRSRGRTVVFGGFEFAPSFGVSNRTHEWDGRNWLQSPATGPSARQQHALVYDDSRRVVLLFGGIGGGNFYSDTWTYDGLAWTQRATTGPSVRLLPGLASDTGRGRVVLFGGQHPITGVQFADTWEWDGASWQAAQPLASPSARHQPACCYDPRRGKVVMVGGLGNVAPLSLREEWEYDGVTWTGPRDVPIDRQGTPFVSWALAWHHRLRGVVLLSAAFGGNAGLSDDLWLGAIDAAFARVEGSGCGGSLVPSLRPFGDPTVGNSRFAVDLDRLPANSLALLGLATTTSATPLGAGCTFRLGAPSVTVAAFANASGFASVQVPIPASASFLGFDVFMQAGALDATAPLGFVMTPAVHAYLGR